LAESITSSECLERLEKEEEDKHAKKLPKVQKKQQDTRCANKPKESKVKPNSNKSEAKTVVVRKPTWFKERPAARIQRSTYDVSVDSVSDASAQPSPHENSPAGTSTVDNQTPHEDAVSLSNCYLGDLAEDLDSTQTICVRRFYRREIKRPGRYSEDDHL